MPTSPWSAAPASPTEKSSGELTLKARHTSGRSKSNRARMRRDGGAAGRHGVLTFGLVAGPYTVHAQTGRTSRVAVLESFSTDEARPYVKAFLAVMRELGHIEGRNLIVDVRTSDRDRTTVPALAD